MGDTLAYALPTVAWRAHPELTLVRRTGTVSWKNTRGSNPVGLEVHKNLSKWETGEMELILFRETSCSECIKKPIAIKHFELGSWERIIYTKKTFWFNTYYFVLTIAVFYCTFWNLILWTKSHKSHKLITLKEPFLSWWRNSPHFVKPTVLLRVYKSPVRTPILSLQSTLTFPSGHFAFSYFHMHNHILLLDLITPLIYIEKYK
jgi:hypothetical protein